MLGIHLLCAYISATVTQRSVRDGHTSNHLEVICSYLCDLLIPSDIETHKKLLMFQFARPNSNFDLV